MNKRVMFSAMVCFLLISFSAAAADVLSAPKDFGTIQQAIDAAPTDAIIHVSAGTYCENLVIARSDLSLHAVDSSADVKITVRWPDGTGRCFPSDFCSWSYHVGTFAQPRKGSVSRL